MRPPRWLELVPPYRGRLSDDGRSVVFTFRVRRRWLWLALVREIVARVRARVTGREIVATYRGENVDWRLR